MAVTNEVVSLSFDNGDFKSRVAETLTALSALRASLKLVEGTSSLASIDSKMQALDFTPITDGIDNLRSNFSLLGVLALNVFNRISNAVISLGQRMASFFTTQPIRQGFSEYELKMTSVRTIMASTGESIEVVGAKLDELNEYADRTIYSFSDMTSNIGKFTNAGVSLDMATAAIKGISSAAALAGANTNEASRAMYNFSQALAQGSVKLIDWKSINLANMATKDFKQQLIECGVAMGTVAKVGDEYVSITADANGNTSEAFTATKNFDNSLSSAWMTTEVLTETLSHYSTDVREMTEAEKEAYEAKLRGVGYTEDQIEAIEELGMKAMDAAQDVNTFSQLVDTVAESLGSSWAQTFELLIGNKEEAKELWTAINDGISPVISAFGDFRNEALETWRDLGGRDVLIESLARAFELLGQALSPIGDAFYVIFGSTSELVGIQLTSLSNRFHDFVYGIELSQETLDSVKYAFEGVFSVLKSVGTVLGGVVKGAVSAGIPLFNTLFQIVSTAAGAIGKAITQITRVSGSAEGVAKTFATIGASLGDLISGFQSGLPTISDFDDLISGVVEHMSGFGSTLGDAVEGLMAGLLDLVNAIKPGLSEFLSGVGIGDVFAMLNANGVIAMVAQLQVFKKQIGGFLDYLQGNVPLFGGTDKISQVLDSFRGSLEAFQSRLNAETLKSIAIAIGILAASMAVLSLLDPEDLLLAGVAISALMVALSKCMLKFVGFGKNIATVGTLASAFVAFGAAMLALSASIALISVLDPDGATQGVVALGIMTVYLVGALETLSNLGAKAVAASASMVLVSAALVGFTASLAVLSLIPAPNLAASILTLSAAMLVLFGGLELLGKSAKGGVALTVAAPGLLALAAALMALSLVPLDNLWSPLILLGGGLAELALGMQLMRGAIGGAAALTIASAGILVLSTALVALSAVGLEGVGTALIALAGSLIIIGAAATLLAPVTVPMVALGVAIALIGAGAALAGAGILLVATALSMLVTVIPDLAAAFVAAKEDIAETIAQLAESAAQGAVSFVTGFARGFVEAIPELVVTVAVGIVTFLTSLASTIREHHQEIYDAAWDLFTAIGEALVDLAKSLLESLGVIGELVTQGLEDWFPDIFGASQENGEAVSDGFEEGADDASDSASKTLDDLLAEFDRPDDFETAAEDLGDEALSGFGDGIDGLPEDAKKELNETLSSITGESGSFLSAGKSVGSSTKSGASTGLDGMGGSMKKKVKDAVNTATTGVDAKSSGKSVGKALVDGATLGVSSMSSTLASTLGNVVKGALAAAKKAAGIASPSKVTRGYGRFIGLGFVVGLESMASNIEDASRRFVRTGLEPVRAYSEEMDALLGGLSGMTSQPVIRPVVDSSQALAEAARISGAFGNQVVGLTAMSSGYMASKAAASVAAGNSQYNFYLQYDAGADATELVRDMTRLVSAGALSNGRR